MQATTCPVCGAEGAQDRPDLRAVDCTCPACGWHYTSPERQAEAWSESEEWPEE